MQFQYNDSVCIVNRIKPISAHFSSKKRERGPIPAYQFSIKYLKIHYNCVFSDIG